MGADDFALTLVVAGAALLVLPNLDPGDTRARAALFGISILFTWRYVAWRLTATLPPLALRFDSLYPWAFAMMEAVASIGWTIAFITLARTRDRSAEATARRPWLTALPQLPRVDILITTYNEAESILRRTIVGALSIDYPEQRVWVLDDGRRDWLERLCQAEGVHYLTRPDNHGAKAGNLNNALAVLPRDADPPEFVAIFDADFVPCPDFLWRTMPLFQERDVGLVQTPQHFFNDDPIQSNLLIGPVWPDEQRFFFDHVMPSKDAWGSAFCCGTSSVIRFRALEDIGGFPTDSVTEDVLVTLKLDCNGWKSVYLNEELSTGLAPEGMKEYLTQRGRWCLGLMQIVRSPLGPFSRSRMSLACRMGLIDSFFYWAASFSFKLFCLTAPIIYWFTGLMVVRATAGETIRYFLPYYVVVLVTLGWATRGLVQPVLTDVAHTLTMFEALKATAVGLLAPRGHSFKVTAKGRRRDRIAVQWSMIGRFGLFAGLTLGGMVYASVADFAPLERSFNTSFVILFWSIYNIIVLLLAMSVCVELPRRRREERFATSEKVRITQCSGLTSEARLADISLFGARVLAPPPDPAGADIMLRIEQVGEIRARIVRGTETSFAVEFAGDDRRDALIRKLYSGRYGQRPPQVRWRELWGALVARAVR
jgi:cellulose synthase (UDP-forming)